MYHNTNNNIDRRISDAVTSGKFTTAFAFYAQHYGKTARQGDEKTRVKNALANICAITIGFYNGHRDFDYFAEQINTEAMPGRALTEFMRLRTAIQEAVNGGNSDINNYHISNYCSRLRRAIPDIDRRLLADMLSAEAPPPFEGFYMDNITKLA